MSLSLQPPSQTPSRPPSVTLPSIGQEGNEYADIEYGLDKAKGDADADDSTQLRSVGGGLELHAPKPSLPQSSAKAQVKTVTRTDDQQAAAHGFGKAGTPTNDEFDLPAKSPGLRSSRAPASGSQPSASPSRRQSIVGVEDEPERTGLGMRVPINPDMGHVQAPSPAPHAGGEAHPHLHHKKRHHHRTKSGREIALPPGSYGLHGHGVHTHDKFDKDWYAKHPEQFVHEETQGHGHYSSTGSGRGEWALSSDDLNKIVRQTASRGAGFGRRDVVVLCVS